MEGKSGYFITPWFLFLWAGHVTPSASHAGKLVLTFYFWIMLMQQPQPCCNFAVYRILTDQWAHLKIHIKLHGSLRGALKSNNVPQSDIRIVLS